ncbi:unnamed protein product [Oppiella nova]|uniref:Neurotransmitter-gated ion-channel ligand-binding domain-containing protein n=1 Tax=Oppiella nova TaxID=334625 RepID=A0A7R9M677_9ACAR|nr:unnamed protein product [Oppiella nova]CAG2171523.1 unnamed protein product [Oppiella nova]
MTSTPIATIHPIKWIHIKNTTIFKLIMFLSIFISKLKCEVLHGKILDMNKVFPEDYDMLMPPKENGKATKVRFHVWVLGLDSIDEGSMTYVADIFMSQSWKDHRLKIPDDTAFYMNSTKSSQYRLLPIGWIKKMWRPDSFFKNAKQVIFQEMTIPNHYIWLYPDKTILYMVK